MTVISCRNIQNRALIQNYSKKKTDPECFQCESPCLMMQRFICELSINEQTLPRLGVLNFPFLQGVPWECYTGNCAQSDTLVRPRVRSMAGPPNSVSARPVDAAWTDVLASCHIRGQTESWRGFPLNSRDIISNRRSDRHFGLRADLKIWLSR